MKMPDMPTKKRCNLTPFLLAVEHITVPVCLAFCIVLVIFKLKLHN